jgi:hypothetical protein
MVVLKKGMGPTKKKKQIVFKNKIETNVPNKKKFGEAHEFCFTNIKTVLQKCVPNKPVVSSTYKILEITILSCLRLPFQISHFLFVFYILILFALAPVFFVCFVLFIFFNGALFSLFALFCLFCSMANAKVEKIHRCLPRKRRQELHCYHCDTGFEIECKMFTHNSRRQGKYKYPEPAQYNMRPKTIT